MSSSSGSSPSTPSPTTSSSPSKTTTTIGSSSSCTLACIQLLKEILVEQPESRPRLLLQALRGRNSTGSRNQEDIQFHTCKDGIEVSIPMDEPPPRNPSKLWTQIVSNDNSSNSNNSNNNNSNNNNNSLLQQTGKKVILGTSPVVNTSQRKQEQAPHVETIQIKCRPCKDTGPESNARAMIMGPNPLSIVACTNRFKFSGVTTSNNLRKDDDHCKDYAAPSNTKDPTNNNNLLKEEMESILIHELIHAYDIQQLQLNFNDCQSMAYSEVRAAREAECYYKWSFLKDYCINQKAIAATNNLYPHQGRKCVRAVMEAAMKDPRPFPNTNTNTTSRFTQQQQQQNNNTPTSNTQYDNTNNTNTKSYANNSNNFNNFNNFNYNKFNNVNPHDDTTTNSFRKKE